jgi:general secretion pathway protein N
MAILQPSGGGESLRVREGAAPEAAPGWVLSSLDARSAVFNGPDGERKLELRVFDGEGGELPTPMSDDGRAPSAAPRPANGASPPRPPRPASTTDANAPPPAQQDDANDNRASAEQIEAIRKRIQERRAKLRQEQPASPQGQNP